MQLLAVIFVFGLIQPWASALRADDRPTMPLLKNFPIRNGDHIKIHEEIGTKYNDLGILLLDDKSGARTQIIVQANGPNADEINSAILQKWIAGEGVQPVAWNILLRCLRAISLNTLADDIAAGISGETNYSTQSEGKRGTSHVLSTGERCTPIKTKQELRQALATVGQWFDLCSNLGASESKLNSLNHSEKQEDAKKRECLDAFFDLGEDEACWEKVVRVVAGYPIENKGLAKRLAWNHGISYDKVVKDEL